MGRSAGGPIGRLVCWFVGWFVRWFVGLLFRLLFAWSIVWSRNDDLCGKFLKLCDNSKDSLRKEIEYGLLNVGLSLRIRLESPRKDATN
jgi:hypothetical protein